MCVHVCAVGGWRAREGDKWRQGQAGVAYYQYESVDRCSVCLLAAGVLG